MAFGCIVDYSGACRWIDENAAAISALDDLEREYTFCCAKLTPLHMAAIAQHSHAINALVEAGAKTDQLLQYLLWHFPDEELIVNYSKRFHQLASEDYLVELFRKNKNSIIRTLFEQNLVQDIFDSKLVRYALLSEDLAMVKWLRENKVELPHIAYFAAATSLECLHWLSDLPNKPEINARAYRGDTALIRICRNEKKLDEATQAEIVQFLLEQGADPSLATDEGYTALMYAQASRRELVVSQLTVA